MKFTVILQPEEGGGYSVVCPAVPGCVSQGDTVEEALTNIREAIALCLEVRSEERFPRPKETPELIAEEIRSCLKDMAEEGPRLGLEIREIDVGVRIGV